MRRENEEGASPLSADSLDPVYVDWLRYRGFTDIWNAPRSSAQVHHDFYIPFLERRCRFVLENRGGGNNSLDTTGS